MSITSTPFLLNPADFPEPPLLEEFKMLCVCMCLADSLVRTGEQDVIDCLAWMASYYRAEDMANWSRREVAEYIFKHPSCERNNHDGRGFNRYLVGQFEGWKMSAELCAAHGGPSVSEGLIGEINTFLTWAWVNFIEHEGQDQ